ncbi:putative ester cyclase [Granulicella aggregans]|uniref:Putative ester cyclase n=1 Tax=Granulicella aggregans TaxID=474949 RepID=A0A7W8E545_9BACT|nr:putative ester cyclase [Granulicella aggregans]
MSLEMNKAVVRRFNLQVIQEGNEEVFRELMADGFINHSAPKGMSSGPDGMWHTFQNILRPALSDLRVVIHDQIAEGDKVTTRKTISGVHEATLLGAAATGKAIAIDVIDIVRLANGQYVEHWGLNTLGSLIASLKLA